MAPGSQTFEQDLFRLYREGVITLDEALGAADSPTNLSWLINNSEIAGSGQHEELRIENRWTLRKQPTAEHRSRNSRSV